MVQGEDSKENMPNPATKNPAKQAISEKQACTPKTKNGQVTNKTAHVWWDAESGRRAGKKKLKPRKTLHFKQERPQKDKTAKRRVLKTLQHRGTFCYFSSDQTTAFFIIKITKERMAKKLGPNSNAALGPHSSLWIAFFRAEFSPSSRY